MEGELLQLQNVVGHVGWPVEVWKRLKKSWLKIHVGYSLSFFKCLFNSPTIL